MSSISQLHSQNCISPRITVVAGFVCFQSANILMTSELFHLGFKHPISLGWFCLNFRLLLLLPKLREIIKFRRDRNNGAAEAEALLLHVNEEADGSKQFNLSHPSSSLKNSPHVHDEKIQRQRIISSSFYSYSGDWMLGGSHVATEFVILLICYIFYDVASVSFTVALTRLNAGIVTAISTTSAAWVCLFSVLFLGRSIFFLDITAVCVSAAGIILISRPWKETPPKDAVATICAIISPMSIAAFIVFFSKVFTHAGWKEVCFILGKLVGINATLGTAVVALALHYGLETVPWQHHISLQEIGLIIGCSLTGPLMTFCMNYAVTITYPLYMSLGGMTSTAVVLIVSGFIDRKWPVGTQWPGIACVLVGFILLMINDWRLAKAPAAQDVDEARNE